MSRKIRHFYEFEDFRLDASNPSLWRGESLVAIPPKALETLTLLVQKKGEIVSREELIETVWKDTFVEEGNINYTISLLRKIFENKDLIKTIPRRGYRFAAEVREISQNGDSDPPPATIQPGPVNARRSFRWLLVAVPAIGILVLTSVAFFLRVEKPAIASVVEPAQNSEAMRSYLRGKMILDNRTVENREEKSIDEFQRAVSLDPTLAIAYAGLAEGFATSAVKIPYPKSRETTAKAKTAADKALALEPNLAEGYLIRGWLKRNFDWDWPGAESDLRHSINLSPKNAIAHQRLSYTLMLVGRYDEALSEVRIAYELDPVSEVISGSRFPILEALGKYDEALAASETLLRENKDSSPAARSYATFLYHTRDYAHVIEIGEPVLTKHANKTPFAWLSLLAASYQNTGQTEKAADALTRLETLGQTDTKALYSLAMNYAELGRTENAIETLQKCFELREERLLWLNVEPRFASLRRHERFRDIVSKLKLS